MLRRGAKAVVYDTRLDQFRARHDIPLHQWAALALMLPAQLRKYRSGQEDLGSDALARLVRAARTLLGRHVKASELYDLGEDEPVAPETHAFPRNGQENIRIRHGSRIGRYMQRIGASPAALARVTGFSRQTLLAWRREKATPLCARVRLLVMTLHRLGYPATASDLFDVGEDAFRSYEAND